MIQSLARYHGPILAAGAVCIVVNWRGLGPLWFIGVILVVGKRGVAAPHDPGTTSAARTNALR